MSPDGVSPFFEVILRCIECVVNGSNSDHQPGQDSQNLVGADATSGVRLAPREWVVCGQ